ncbi:hypothetical protein ACHHYP_08598 [Achlya hypogyna]|uniref:Uncharacterized protein n=1 Tax=Achlya hypogyna TaxID=1202772 RepID=A0A1V9ZKE0_ACHHY|nr:hypothetical protein ACHHYP_08598 [Achlya hypogyna]
MSDDDSDSEEVLFSAQGPAYPGQKLRRVREIFLSRPQFEPSRRKSACDALPRTRQDVDGRRRSEPGLRTVEITTSEDDSADDFTKFFGNQAEDDPQTEKRSRELADALTRAHKLCARPATSINISIDEHIGALENRAAVLESQSALEPDLVSSTVKELERSHSLECEALRLAVAQHQASTKAALRRLESDFLQQVDQLRIRLAQSMRAEESQAHARMAATATQLRHRLDQAARPQRLPRLASKPAKATTGEYCRPKGPSVDDIPRGLATLPPLPAMNRRVESKLAACSPGMLARVARLGRPKIDAPPEWPQAPQSPHRRHPSHWDRGCVGAGSMDNCRGRVSREDNNLAPLNGRFLRPDEERELRALKNSLGLATAWMEMAME